MCIYSMVTQLLCDTAPFRPLFCRNVLYVLRQLNYIRKKSLKIKKK